MTDRNYDHLKPNLAKAREAFRRNKLESRGASAPAIPDGVDWRPLRGFPGFYIDRDKAVWTFICKNGSRGPWRKSGIVMKGRHKKTPSACLRRPDGTVALVSVAKLHHDAFLHPELPSGSPLGEGKDYEGECERDGDAMGLPIVRTIAPARKVATPPPPMPTRAMPRTPAPPIARLAPRPPADHPGGSLRLGPMARGSAHGRSKLDEAKVARMKRLRLEGWSTGKLAREFGVNRHTVCYILNGKTWGHVEAAPPENGGAPC